LFGFYESNQLESGWIWFWLDHMAVKAFDTSCSVRGVSLAIQ
jgi:hypothetical protein